MFPSSCVENSETFTIAAAARASSRGRSNLCNFAIAQAMFAMCWDRNEDDADLRCVMAVAEIASMIGKLLIVSVAKAQARLASSCVVALYSFASATVPIPSINGMFEYRSLANAQAMLATSRGPNSETWQSAAADIPSIKGMLLIRSFATAHAVAARPCGEAKGKAASAALSSSERPSFACLDEPADLANEWRALNALIPRGKVGAFVPSA